MFSTLSQVLPAFGQSVVIKQKSAEESLSRINRVLRDPICQVPLDQIERRHIREFRDRYAARMTGSSVNRMLAVLGAGFNWAVSEHDAPEKLLDVCRKMKLPENPARDRRLRPGEEQRLLDVSTQVEPWLGPVIRLAVATAMRRGEMVALRWRDVSGCVAKLHTTKNGDARSVPLSKAAREAMDDLRVLKINDKVIPCGCADAITDAFGEACRLAGIKGLRFHDLRGEALSRYAEKGLDIRALHKIGGHKSGAILRYLRPGGVEELAARMG